MITNTILKPFIESAVNNVLAINKILAVYYNFVDKELSFSVVVSSDLNQEELEEIRIAQTELLADFPDGEIEIFKINQYFVTDIAGGDAQTKISGDLFYKSDEMNKLELKGEVRGYKLFDSEKSEIQE